VAEGGLPFAAVFKPDSALNMDAASAPKQDAPEPDAPVPDAPETERPEIESENELYCLTTEMYI